MREQEIIEPQILGLSLHKTYTDLKHKRKRTLMYNTCLKFVPVFNTLVRILDLRQCWQVP